MTRSMEAQKQLDSLICTETKDEAVAKDRMRVVALLEEMTSSRTDFYFKDLKWCILSGAAKMEKAP